MEKVASLGSGRVPLRASVVQALGPARLACAARNGAIAAQLVSIAEPVASLGLVGAVFHLGEAVVRVLAPAPLACAARNGVSVA